MLLTLLISISLASVDIPKDTLSYHYVKNNMEDFPADFQSFYQKFYDYESLYFYDYQGLLAFDLYDSGIDKSLLCRKFLAVSVSGTWHADQIGCLLDTMFRLAMEYPDLFAEELSRFSRKEQKSVWKFMFSELYPSNLRKEYENLISNPYMLPFKYQIIHAFRDGCRREKITEKDRLTL